MKKQDDLYATFRTTIKDISPLGSALSDAQLRRVAGGLPKKTYQGVTGDIPRGSAKPDYSYDE